MLGNHIQEGRSLVQNGMSLAEEIENLPKDEVSSLIKCMPIVKKIAVCMYVCVCVEHLLLIFYPKTEYFSWGCNCALVMNIELYTNLFIKHFMHRTYSLLEHLEYDQVSL